MALDNQYRVHEVAKDFGVSSREITEILTKYRTEPKNHMQVLDDADLSVIFEYMTQHHQVKNMESLLGAQQSERKEQPAAKQGEAGREGVGADFGFLQGQAGTPHRYARHRRRKPCKVRRPCR